MATETEIEHRVAARTPPADLASAISHSLYDNKSVKLRAVGAGAVNQAVKAIIIAQQFVAARGLVIATRPGFIDVKMDNEDRTGIVFNVFVVN